MKQHEKINKFTFASRLSDLRSSRKMSQIKLATLIGLTQESVSALENGVSSPRLSTLIKLSEVLECSIDYLLGLSDVKQPALSRDLLDNTQQHLLENYKMCSSRDRDIIMLMSEILARKGVTIEVSDNTVIVKNFLQDKFGE